MAVSLGEGIGGAGLVLGVLLMFLDAVVTGFLLTVGAIVFLVKA